MCLWEILKSLKKQENIFNPFDRKSLPKREEVRAEEYIL